MANFQEKIVDYITNGTDFDFTSDDITTSSWDYLQSMMTQERINDPRYQRLLGLFYQYYDKIKNIETAKSYYMYAIDHQETCAMFDLASLYEREGNFRDAERYYIMSIEKQSKSKSIERVINLLKMCELGVMYERTKDPKFAEQYCDVHTNASTMARKTIGKRTFALAEMYDRNGDKVNAIKYYRKSLEAGNNYSACKLGSIYESYYKDIPNALKYYLVGCEGGCCHSMTCLANLYMRTNDLENAEKYFKMSIEKGDSEAMFGLGYLNEQQSMFGLDNRREKEDAALMYYALAIEKNNPEAMYRVGIIYSRHNDKNRAIKYYRMASDAGHIESLYALAETYECINDFKNAEKYYKLSLENKVSAPTNLVQLALGELYDKMGDIVNEKKYLKMSADGGCVTAMDRYAEICEQEMHYIDAIKYYQMAIDKYSVYAPSKLAALCAKMGDTANAVRYAELFMQRGYGISDNCEFR